MLLFICVVLNVPRYKTRNDLWIFKSQIGTNGFISSYLFLFFFPIYFIKMEHCGSSVGVNSFYPKIQLVYT